MNIPSNSSLEIDGLSYTVLEHDIHHFYYTAMTKAAVDASVEIILQLDQQYSTQQKHVQYMYNLEEAWFTQYMLWGIMKVFHTTPDTLYESSAVIADLPLVRVIQRAIRPELGIHPLQKISFFKTQDDALDWLAVRRQQVAFG